MLSNIQEKDDRWTSLCRSFFCLSGMGTDTCLVLFAEKLLKLISAISERNFCKHSPFQLWIMQSCKDSLKVALWTMSKSAQWHWIKYTVVWYTCLNLPPICIVMHICSSSIQSWFYKISWKSDQVYVNELVLKQFDLTWITLPCPVVENIVRGNDL
jgi:hypothetical protein